METDLKTRQDLRLFVTMVPTFMHLKVLKTNRRRAIVLIEKVILRYPNKFLQLKNAVSMILESFFYEKSATLMIALFLFPSLHSFQKKLFELFYSFSILAVSG